MTTATETAETFTVIIDPWAARSIIADYATYEEAEARFEREASRMRDHGGSAYISWNGTTLKACKVRAELVELGHKGRSLHSR